jgi:glutamate-1-semialdehyde 2,1-aminomutase
MVELAEYLVSLVPIADWALFAKNGNDATSLSLMVARMATGRDKIVLIERSYHGSAPWAQRPGSKGTVDADHGNVLYTGWNDYEGLERLVEEHPNEIAGFLSTPYFHPAFADNELPDEDYWSKVRSLCTREGIVLIVDDVRCGFRLDMGGSNEYFGFKPDLLCFSKAIANGYPLSALVGTDALKSECEKVFITGSFWFSAVPMAAALATLKELERIDGPKIMLETGRRLAEGMGQIAESYGYDLKFTGVTSMPFVRLAGYRGAAVEPEAHQRWCGECTKRGAFFASHHNWFLSTAHGDREIVRTLEIVEDAFRSLSEPRR